MDPFRETAQQYGAATRKSFQPIALKKATLVNSHGLIAAFVIPVVLFCVILSVMSLELHYQHPLVAYSIVFLGLLLVLSFGVLWWSRRGQEASGELPRTWYRFLFFACLIAWILAMLMGDYNYHMNAIPFYDAKNLNLYSQVDPRWMSGDQLMDAGTVIFAEGARVDINKSYAFKNHDVYCVAPVTFGNDELTSYDFWAVGVNCCSGNQKDFNCGDVNMPNAASGFRLMQDEQRAFFRLAVQQAEAAYMIRADHPLFFNWVQDPVGMIEKFDEAAEKFVVMAGSAFFLIHLAIMVMVVLVVASMSEF